MKYTALFLLKRHYELLVNNTLATVTGARVS